MTSYGISISIVVVIKMTVGDRIKLQREIMSISQTDLANKVGISKQTLYKYEKNIVTNIPSDKIERIAETLSTTPQQLMGWEDDNLKFPEITSDTVSFPVIGEIAAGYDHFAYEDWSGETVEIPASFLKGRKKEDFFVLSVKGDSMYPLYMDGDKVLILKQTTLNHSGQIGAIVYEDYATLKKIEYVMGEDWLNMVPINPQYQPKRIEGPDLEQCRVLGIPKLLIREIVEI